MKRAVCCAWAAELIDDSLKTAFQSDEAYANGNRTKAIAYLKAQADIRLPAIEKRVARCGGLRNSPRSALSGDIGGLASLMLASAPAAKIHSRVMAFDKKYALVNYRAFARCVG